MRSGTSRSARSIPKLCGRSTTASDAATEGDNKGKTYRGIYTLEGDTYRLCRHQQAEGKRPTEFKAEDETMVIVWKKDKP